MPVPRLAMAGAAGLVRHVPFMPAEAQWIHAFRTPVLIDCSRARDQLGWSPRHSGAETLHATIEGSQV